MSKDLRPAIIHLFQQGHKKSEIVTLLGVPKQTVSSAIKRFNETSSNDDRARSGRPVTATTEENIQVIANKICCYNDHEAGHIHSSSDFTRSLATELGISHMSVQKMIEEIFEMKSRKTMKGPFLNDNVKKKRHDAACRFAANRHRRIMFTDEKWFDLEQAHNSQNDRIWSVDPLPPELKFVGRQQKPKQVMVWAGVSCNAKAPFIFVPNGTKVNGPAYRQMLETEALPWAEANLDDNWCFQQDGAPSHQAYETQAWIAQNFPDAITVDPHWTNPSGEWPPNSPELNVITFSRRPALGPATPLRH